MNRWLDTKYSLPEKGIVVETISPGGEPSTLKLINGLWFVPDGSMYVYYTPKYWRYIDAG